MNFLAHLYLSGRSDDMTIGNFIGDFVKGNDFQNYPDEVAAGILLHREIDAFTDTHPTVRACRKNLWNPYRHYAGVITDVFFDHFLASKWNEYHMTSLEQFAQQSYELIESKEHLLPPPAAHMFPYMKGGNWLVSYALIEGIDRALTGLSRRTTFKSGMEHASESLINDYSFYHDAFTDFFPDLMNFVARKNESFELPDLK